MSDEHLLPLQDEEETGGFDVVLRGYDRRQVEDYVERVEIALAEADRSHAEDGERVAAFELELTNVRSRLADAEQRAAGLPEPASRVGERLAQMLRLAEEEADQIVEQARDRANASHADRTAELDRREAELVIAQAAADSARLDAQRDAEAVRARAQDEANSQVTDAQARAQDQLGRAKAQSDEHIAQAEAHANELVTRASEEAEHKRRTAEEDVKILHEDARQHAQELVADAQRQVAELSEQRDLIASQLQQLRETLAAAVRPLGGPSSDQP